MDACKAAKLLPKLKKKGLFPKGPLPSKLVELGDLEKVVLTSGKLEAEISFENYKLFVWDDMNTLMALPMDGRGHVIDDGEIYIWSSKHTKVNWRGIID